MTTTKRKKRSSPVRRARTPRLQANLDTAPDGPTVAEIQLEAEAWRQRAHLLRSLELELMRRFDSRDRTPELLRFDDGLHHPMRQVVRQIRGELIAACGVAMRRYKSLSSSPVVSPSTGDEGDEHRLFAHDSAKREP